jgi:hypothetical protein
MVACLRATRHHDEVGRDARNPILTVAGPRSGISRLLQPRAWKLYDDRVDEVVYVSSRITRTIPYSKITDVSLECGRLWPVLVLQTSSGQRWSHRIWTRHTAEMAVDLIHTKVATARQSCGQSEP